MTQELPASEEMTHHGTAVNVVDSGAVGDGSTLNTEAIQAAIDHCAEKGGGVVYLGPGRFLSGTIVLKSYVTLHLSAGAVLLGSVDPKDYPISAMDYPYRGANSGFTSLVYAERAQNVAITGRGTMDGQGAHENFRLREGVTVKRPHLLDFVECRQVSVKEVMLRNPASWVQNYVGCDDVLIDGITVLGHANKNNDGLDISDCRNVRVANCHIDGDDDAIVLKSFDRRGCRRVTVTNCILRSSGANAFKLGTDSSGGFRDIVLSNSVIYDTRLAGIALEIVDGGTIDRVSISNITMDNLGCAIFVRLGDRAREIAGAREKPPPGILRNVILDNIQATRVGSTLTSEMFGAVRDPTPDKMASSITGIPGHTLEDVTLSNVRIAVRGGMHKAEIPRADSIPKDPDGYPGNYRYPEFIAFDKLPAYGLYIRNVRNVRLHNVELGFEEQDERPAILLDDVQDADIWALRAQMAPGADSVLHLVRSNRVFVHGSWLPGPTSETVCVHESGAGAVGFAGNWLPPEG